jgi:hypothetical protein
MPVQILKERKMPIHLIQLSSDIVEDDPEDGLLDSTGCGYCGQAIGRSFDTDEKAIAYLADTYGYSSDIPSWEIRASSMQSSKQVANHSEAQNGGWMVPTEAETQAWLSGKFKLYEELVTVNFLRH